MTEMTESLALDTWSTPICPFTIEYSRRLLDDIRLSVVDAFFSLPRGGAEIGGVLLGKFAEGRVAILEYTPLECEHIFGPSFTLSPADHVRLTELLAAAGKPPSDLRPVGWYHSHTRSDIFLSEADLDIHNRYFPEPWQVALVLRPSTFQPVQAGFFFRDSDGNIHASSSYQEFALHPMPLGQMPQGMPGLPPQPTFGQAEPEGPMITLPATAVTTPLESQPSPQTAAEAAPFPTAEPTPPPRMILLPPELPPLPRLELVPELGEPPRVPLADVYAEADKAVDGGSISDAPPAVETVLVEPKPPIAVTSLAAAEAPPAPAAESKPEPRPQPQVEELFGEPPSFLQVEPVRSRRRLWVTGALAAAVVIGVGGYQQRASWMPQGASSKATAPAPVPLTLPLSASDQQGQLQIRWDGAAQAITQARDGILQITDEGATTDLPLDTAHLQGGAFAYARRGEHVDARLTVQELDGTQVRSTTSFYGALPEPVKPVAADPLVRKQNFDLTKQNANLARANGELQGRLDELNKQIAKQKVELSAHTATAKQNADLARQNAELRQQRDDLAKQAVQLKTDLAARAASAKQGTEKAQQDAQLLQQRDDLLLQVAKLKTELTARATATKQNTQQSAEFSKQRYQLVNKVTQLQSDLAVATARADRLTQQLEELRKQQTQRRLQNQSGGPAQ